MPDIYGLDWVSRYGCMSNCALEKSLPSALRHTLPSMQVEATFEDSTLRRAANSVTR